MPTKVICQISNAFRQLKYTWKCIKIYSHKNFKRCTSFPIRMPELLRYFIIPSWHFLYIQYSFLFLFYKFKFSIQNLQHISEFRKLHQIFYCMNSTSKRDRNPRILVQKSHNVLPNLIIYVHIQILQPEIQEFRIPE